MGRTSGKTAPETMIHCLGCDYVGSIFDKNGFYNSECLQCHGYPTIEQELNRKAKHEK